MTLPAHDDLARWIGELTGRMPEMIHSLPSSGSTVLAVEAPGRSLIVRRMTDPAWRDRDPDAIAREARVLSALASTSVPAPRVVGVDPDGSTTGVPTLAVERLPGTGDATGFGDLDGHRLLAEPLRAIHDVDASVAGRPYRRYTEPDGMWAPPWATDTALWSEAIEATRTPPAGPDGFLHRDYHGGNVLTEHGVVTGVVDWIEACHGPQAVDAARAAVNLALAHGSEQAGRFLHTCRRLGIATDPYWTLVDALDIVDWYDGEDAVGRWTGPAGHEADTRPRLEHWLRATLRAL